MGLLPGPAGGAATAAIAEAMLRRTSVWKFAVLVRDPVLAILEEFYYGFIRSRLLQWNTNMTQVEKKSTFPSDPGLRPLCVDLDGTLVRTDLLLESTFALLRKNILYLFMLPLWLLRGKATLKQEIANRVSLDASLLPYNEQLLKYLHEQRASGRSLTLATASNEKFANNIASHLNIFDNVFASNATTNLACESKRVRLVEQFTEGGFDYAANAMADISIWKSAHEAIIVNPEPGVVAAAERQTNICKIIDDRQDDNKARYYLHALRAHQWLKNILIFVPLVMSHRLDEPALIVQGVLGFISFGLCASSVYLLNDLLDLPSDRAHPSKRNRPFASGSISILHGTALIPLLLIAAFSIALLLPGKYIFVLCVYYTLTLAYSLVLKRAAIIDVLLLASLYTIRILAGGAAVTVPLSFWLLAFSMFLFLSLGLIKRYTELLTMSKIDRTDIAGRGYRIGDLSMLREFGTASAYISVLVLALYINSNTVRDMYSHPDAIWLLCPLLLYTVSRLWLMASRDELHEDPVVFVIRDRRSQILALIAMAFLWIAS